MCNYISRNIRMWQRLSYKMLIAMLLKITKRLETAKIYNQFSCSVLSNSLPPMDCSTQGFLVHHQLLEFTQTNVHRVGDAIQPSNPLSSSSPPAVNLSQHQGLFK